MSTQELPAKPQSEIQIAGMFNSIAKKYDAMNTILSAAQDRRWRKVLVRCFPKAFKGKHLDVATGTGDVLIEAVKQRKDYSEFIGVDISEGMLAIAKKKANSQNISADKNVQFKTMSAENLELADNSFDCVTISFGLRNVINKEKAIQEFSRVLKPGSNLIILEFFLPEKGMLAGLFQLYFKRLLPLIGAMFSSSEAYSYLPRSVEKFYSKKELRSILVKSRFVMDKEISFLFGACKILSFKKL